MSGATARMLVVLIACTACGGHATHPHAARAPGVEITLYRDHAVVAHRLEVVIPAAAPAKLTLRVAADVSPDDLYLVEHSELAIKQVVVLGAATERPQPGCDEMACVMDNYERACCARFERKSEWDDGAPVAKPVTGPRTPIDVEVTLGGPREGRFAVVIGYDTPRFDWDAAYSLTTTASRVRSELTGALVVRNATGIAFPHARLAVVDGEHADVKARLAKQVAGGTIDANETPIAQPRELGHVDLIEGDARFGLISHVLETRPTLVFDAVGPGLDYQHGQPALDPNLGIVPAPSTRVVESLSFERPPVLRGLPGGPVRVFERKPDGALALLAEATLFGAATLISPIDTVPLGVADQVTGKRERRELTIDNDRKRITEEFGLVIDNARPRPIEVLLREHLYRGTGWTIAYWSVPQIDKEGKQQVAMWTTVPPRGKQTVIYVVVYEWGKDDVKKK